MDKSMEITGNDYFGFGFKVCLQDLLPFLKSIQ